MAGFDKKKGASRGRRPPSPHYKANDEGGYGNPPVSSQFKSGGAGGPGRPKGSTSLATAMKKAFHEKVTLRDGTKVDTTHAIAMRARQMSLTTNSVSALKFGMELADKFGPQEPSAPSETHDALRLREAELKILFVASYISLGTPITLDSKADHFEPSELLGTYRVFVRRSGELGIEKISNYHSFKGEESPTIAEMTKRNLDEFKGDDE